MAILVLRPDMCKDKLTQVSGKMFQLECRLKLVMVGAKEVFEKIRGMQVASKLGVGQTHYHCLCLAN